MISGILRLNSKFNSVKENGEEEAPTLFNVGRAEVSDASGSSQDIPAEDIACIDDALVKSFASQPVTLALKSSAVVTDSNIYSEDLVFDLLNDVGGMSRQASHSGGDCNTLPMTFFKTEKKLCSGTRVFINTVIENYGFISESTSPMIDKGIRLEMEKESGLRQYYSIFLNNKFLCWVWLRAISRLFSVWRDSSQATGDDDFTCVANVELEEDCSDTVLCSCVMKVADPFMLYCYDNDSKALLEKVPLDRLCSVVLSDDLPLSHEYIVEVTVMSAMLNVVECKEVKPEAENDVGWQPGKFAKIGGSSIFKGVKDMAAGVAGVAVGVTTGAAKGAISSVQTVQNLVVQDAGTNLAMLKQGANKAFSTIGNTFDLNNPRTHIVCNALNVHFTSKSVEGSEPEYFETFQLSLSESDVQSGSLGHKGVNVFMFNGSEGYNVCGQHFVPLSKLLRFERGLPGDARSVEDGATIQSVFPLDKAYEYSVRVLNGSDLAMCKSTCEGDVDYYVKIRFAKWNGDRKTLKFKEYRTKTVTCENRNPNWSSLFGNDECLLSAEDGLYWADFVRLEIFVGSGLNGTRIGSVFIPLDDFTDLDQDIEYPVSHFKYLPSSMVKAGLGTLRVKISKRSNAIDCDAAVKLKATIRRCNIYNTLWPMEAMLSGTVLQPIEKPKCESFSVAPAYDGLWLVENGSEVSRSGSFLDPMSQLFAPLGSMKLFRRNSYGNGSFSKEKEADKRQQDLINKRLYFSITHLSDYIDENGNDINGPIEIEMYEYERRSIFPPYDFGGSNLLINEPFPFSDETGAHKAPFDSLEESLAPFGYDWAPVYPFGWKVDREYTATDDNGWCYGVTIGAMRSNLKNKVDCASAFGLTVRRKRWTRVAYPQTIDTELCGQSVSNSLAKSLSDTSTMVDSLLPSRADVSASFSPEENVLMFCEERADMMSNVIIPWNQVKSVDVISASILSVAFQIHRYFPGTPGTSSESPMNMSAGTIAEDEEYEPAETEIFRPAIVEAFIYGCPAIRLKSLIEERIGLFEIRKDISAVLKSGNVSNTVSKSTKKKSDLETKGSDKLSGDFRKLTRFKSVAQIKKAPEEEECIPETIELSKGSETIETLDFMLLEVEQAAGTLQTLFQRHPEDRAIRGERYVILRRVCRLNLYIASLLGAGLEVSHDFDSDAVVDTIRRDLSTTKAIAHHCEVDTASNKIQFLLDTVEMRIRETALCGWNHQDNVLEKVLELMINSYYCAMVSLLQKFFDESGDGMASLQGLNSKVKLILFFMKNDGRLENLLKSALRPYNLEVTPAPRLSEALDLDCMLTLYNNILQQEMTKYVDNTLKIWSDPSRKTSDLQFTHALPWQPARFQRNGPFVTRIPEDVKSALIEYLTYAKIQSSHVAPHFKANISNMNAMVRLAFCSSFLYLADKYSEAFRGTEWIVMSKKLAKKFNIDTSSMSIDIVQENDVAGEKLNDHVAWLCSVANDMYRVMKDGSIYQVEEAVDDEDDNDDSDTDNENDDDVDADAVRRQQGLRRRAIEIAIDVSDTSTKCIKSYNDLHKMSLEMISCVIFSSMHALLDPNFVSAWLSHSERVPEDSAEVEDGPFEKAVAILMDEMNVYRDLLEISCYQTLVEICAEKIVIVFFCLIKSLYVSGSFVGGDDGSKQDARLKQLVYDLSLTIDCFQKLSDVVEGDGAVIIELKVRRLPEMLVLLTAARKSEEFVAALNAVVAEAAVNAEESLSLANYLFSVVSIRSDASPELLSMMDRNKAVEFELMQYDFVPTEFHQSYGHVVKCEVSCSNTSMLLGAGREETDWYLLHEDHNFKALLTVTMSYGLMPIREQEGNVAVTVLNRLSPETRVFDTTHHDIARRNPTLFVQLVQSATVIDLQDESGYFKLAVGGLSATAGAVARGTSNIAVGAARTTGGMAVGAVRRTSALASDFLHVFSTAHTDTKDVPPIAEEPVALQKLQIGAIEVKNLFKMSSRVTGAYCDPYLEVSMGGHTHMTSVKYGETNPCFDEVFEWTYDSDAHEEEICCIQVKLHYHGSVYGVLLGSLSIPVHIQDGILDIDLATAYRFNWTAKAKPFAMEHNEAGDAPPELMVGKLLLLNEE